MNAVYAGHPVCCFLAAAAAALEALEQRPAHLRENLRTPELRDEFEQANKFRRE